MKWIASLAVLALALPAWGGLYKWIDDDGKVHYSDQPPPVNSKQQKSIQPPPGVSGAAAPSPQGQPQAPTVKAPKTVAEQEMEFRKRRVEAAEAEAKRQQEAQSAAEKQRNCGQARNRVAVLQQGGRITKGSSSGEQLYLGDEEIARELVEARKVADSWCK